MNFFSAVIGTLLCSLLLPAGPAPRRQDTPDIASDVSYLVVQTETGRVIEERWDDIEKLIPMGSLLKPFTAIAYAETHLYQYPVSQCAGLEDGCWLPGGHGRLNIRSAIADSCNTYFRHLAEAISTASVASVAWRFGISGPPVDVTSESFVGLGGRWKIAPLHLARAYAEFVRRSRGPAIAPLLQGLALAGRSGTGEAVGKALGAEPVLVKTGTGPCVHRGRSNGDGYTIALYPAEKPRVTLLVQVHGVPGRIASGVCGRLLAERVLKR